MPTRLDPSELQALMAAIDQARPDEDDATADVQADDDTSRVEPAPEPASEPASEILPYDLLAPARPPKLLRLLPALRGVAERVAMRIEVDLGKRVGGAVRVTVQEHEVVDAALLPGRLPAATVALPLEIWTAGTSP